MQPPAPARVRSENRPAPLRLLMLVIYLVLLAGVACTRRDIEPAQGGVGGAAPSPPAIAPGSASPGRAGDPSPVPQGGTYTVNMGEDRRYSPVTLNAPRGSTITWVNHSQVPHTVTTDQAQAKEKAKGTVPPNVQHWDSGPIAPGQTFTRTLDAPGAYQYFCTFHGDEGMVATITVGQ